MSATTPEGRIKRKVTKVLKDAGVWYFFPASNGFGAAGIPDIIAILGGQFIGIECKADKTKKPTELQRRCGEKIIEAGGVWMVVCDDETMAPLRALIKLVGSKQRFPEDAQLSLQLFKKYGEREEYDALEYTMKRGHKDAGS